MPFNEAGSPRRTGPHSTGTEINLHEQQDTGAGDVRAGSVGAGDGRGRGRSGIFARPSRPARRTAGLVGRVLALAGRVLALAARRLVFNSGHVAAAAIAYYGLVSMFPLVLLMLSALGFLFPVTTLADRLVRVAADLLPGSGAFFRENLEQLVVHRGGLGLAAVLTLYWSASGAFHSLGRALDLVLETPVDPDPDAAFLGPVRTPPLTDVWRRVRALGVVVGVGALFLLSIAATTYLRLAERLQSVAHLVRLGPAATLVLLHLLPVVITAVVFLGVYALIPRRTPPWRALWPGTLCATVLFEAAKGSFAWYASRLERYSWVYGSVTAAIVLLVWFYVAAIIIIYGAEVGAVVRARAWRSSDRPGSKAAPRTTRRRGRAPAYP